MKLADETTYMPMKVGEWLATLFLFSIPLVNIVLAIYWSMSSEIHPSKKSWAQASLIMGVIVFVIIVIFGGTLASTLGYAIFTSSQNVYEKNPEERLVPINQKIDPPATNKPFDVITKDDNLIMEPTVIQNPTVEKSTSKISVENNPRSDNYKATDRPRIGESIKSILSKFGEPNSQMTLGNKKILNYDNYSITVVNGNVSKISDN